jgi:hypothetical protein
MSSMWVLKIKNKNNGPSLMDTMPDNFPLNLERFCIAKLMKQHLNERVHIFFDIFQVFFENTKFGASFAKSVTLSWLFKEILKLPS